MVVGLGTGRTANYATVAISKLVSEGMDIIAIPTSDATADFARKLGITLSSLDEHGDIAVTIDGADEVDASLNLIKGRGGALVREKIVAASTRREIIVVDEQKMVSRLGHTQPVPVEILRFGSKCTMNHLSDLGADAVLRKSGTAPYVTDNGNYIADCKFDRIDDPRRLERDIDSIPGTVECGLFVGIAYAVVVGSEKGAKILKRNAS
jgi:ribose 5-phosphate isomerase A